MATQLPSLFVLSFWLLSGRYQSVKFHFVARNKTVNGELVKIQSKEDVA